MKNKKLLNIVKALGTFLLLIALLFSGGLVFHSYYYELIYVSGSSMYPTLNKRVDDEDVETVGSIVDFGIIDPHKSALKHIKRFDIVSTYYPDSTDYDLDSGLLKSDARKKIKRIIALPNETFKIEKGLLYVSNNDNDFELIPYTFETNPIASEQYTGKDTFNPITLKDNEYWVLGDNRSASRDCATIGMPIKRENLIGVLVAIEGRGKLYAKDYVCSSCGRKQSIKEGSVCKKCYSAMKIEYDVGNKQYQWPKFY